MNLNSLSVRKMRVFLSVIENGSFTKAAVEQNMSQPAVTIIINQIEELTSTALFERHGQVRKAVPTSSGKEVASIFSRIVGSYDDELVEMSELCGGRREITSVLIQDSFAAAVNPVWLDKLMDMLGQSRVEIKLESRDRIIEQVSARKARFALVDGNVMSDTADYLPLKNYGMALVVPSQFDFTYSNRSAISWDEVPESTYLLGGLSKQTTRQVGRQLESRSGATRSLVEVSCPSLIGSMMNTSGIPAIVPSFIAPAIQEMLDCQTIPICPKEKIGTSGVLMQVGQRANYDRFGLRLIAPFKSEASGRRHTQIAYKDMREKVLHAPSLK